MKKPNEPANDQNLRKVWLLYQRATQNIKTLTVQINAKKRESDLLKREVKRLKDTIVQMQKGD